MASLCLVIRQFLCVTLFHHGHVLERLCLDLLALFQAQVLLESNHSLLAKFGALLANIVRFVRSLEDRRIEINHEEESNILEFREQGGSVSPALPADVAGQLSDELTGL
jgi:transcriptional regulator with GAF, ATPase, and Fis domain